jgi:hypothetical protein
MSAVEVCVGSGLGESKRRRYCMQPSSISAASTDVGIFGFAGSHTSIHECYCRLLFILLKTVVGRQTVV